MNALRVGAVLTILCAAGGCGGQTIGAASTHDGAGDGSVAEPDGGRGGTGGEAADSSLEPPADLLRLTTVWIGQAALTVTYPEDLTERAPQKVVLILGAVVDANAVSGTITFGDGAPPVAPTNPDQRFPPGIVLADNLKAFPYAGFEYSIEWSDLRQDHLTLAFRPPELFRDWCAIQAPRPGGYAEDQALFCDCSLTECHPVSDPIRRIDLVVHDAEMEGQLSFPTGSQNAPIDIRLRRVQ